MKQVSIILAVSLLVAFLLTALFIFLGRLLIQDSSIPLKSSFVEEGEPKRIMTFFAHPDDEIAIAGTLLGAKEQGHEVILICLTKGEAGTTGGLVERSELASVRSRELYASGEILGAAAVEIFDFPDGGLVNVDFSEIEQTAKMMINKYRPDYLISYDSEVGLYGHPDHRIASKALEKVFLNHKGQSDFPVSKYFQVTLSAKQIDLAMRISSGFRNNYPKDGKGLPLADFAIRTRPYFSKIIQMIEAHQTQQEVLRDFLPYHDKIPAFIYSRIFDREYFFEFK